MKRFLFIGAIFIHFITYSQSGESIQKLEVTPEKQADIQTFFNQYFEETKNMDFDKLLDKTHPGLYKLASREQVKTQLDQAFNNGIFTTSFDEMEFKNITKAFAFENVEYYILDYYAAFSFGFIKEDSQSEDDFDSYLTLMQSLFKNEFKDSEVIKTGNSISIKGNKQIVLIDDPELDGYKMLEAKKEMTSLYAFFLPKLVVVGLFQ